MATKLTGSQDIDIFKDERRGKLREVGNQAVWSLSSCKPGFGVDQLRDESYDTYWQSDGPQPHMVNIQFRRKTTVHDVCLYADYKADESYTPNRISIRAGTHFHDLAEVEQVELSEPGVHPAARHWGQAHPHIHDPDCHPLQPPERPRHPRQTHQDSLASAVL